MITLALSFPVFPLVCSFIFSIVFYRKAKKLDTLGQFFIECSQFAIDSTGDYERGIQLLGEAIKQLSSSKTDTTELQQLIRSRAMKIKEFIDLKTEFSR